MKYKVLILALFTFNITFSQLLEISFDEKKSFFKDKELKQEHKKKIKYDKTVDLLDFKRVEKNVFLLHIIDHKTQLQGYLKTSQQRIRQLKAFKIVIEKIDFERATKQNTEEAYLNYLKYHNKWEAHYNKAKLNLTELQFKKAATNKDVVLMRNIIKKQGFKLGFEREKEMKRELCALELVRITNLNPYSFEESRRFFSECSTTLNDEERELMCTNESNHLIKNATSQQNFNAYISNCTNHSRFNEILKRYQEFRLQEEKLKRAKTDYYDFKTAQAIGSYDAYKNYLLNHPDGKHVKNAINNIKDVKIEQLKKPVLLKKESIKGVLSPNVAMSGETTYPIGLLNTYNRIRTVNESALIAGKYIYFKEGQLIDFLNAPFPDGKNKKMYVVGKGKASLIGITLLPGTFIFRELP